MELSFGRKSPQFDMPGTNAKTFLLYIQGIIDALEKDLTTNNRLRSPVISALLSVYDDEHGTAKIVIRMDLKE